MFNLLCMDLYRIKRSKFAYVCFGCLLGVIFLSYLMVWLMATPKGQETALKLGMLVHNELEEGRALLAEADVLAMFRESGMDGGMYSLIFGVAVALLVCGDYQGGFMKNIMSLHRQRQVYIGSKLMAAGILNFLYLALGFAFNMLMNQLFQHMVPASDWRATLFYLGWAWVLTTGFAALIILLCVLSRSTTIGVLGAVFGGSGLIVMLLHSITSQFHLGGWVEYTIYYNLTYGPSSYASVGDLRGAAVGLAFLALYSAASVVVIRKRDI